MKSSLALVGAILMLAVVGTAGADVNAVTPSTNAINQANGWAHVDQSDVGLRTITLTFTSARSFYSCFEYRTDGDTSQILSENSGSNYNTAVTDGLYPYICVNNEAKSVTLHPKAYVEVRMVFGAERDERFDWTRFNVDSCALTGFVRDGTDLTAAQIGGNVTGTLDATGCNIGVYYKSEVGSVSNATVFGANYYGIVADGANVSVSGTTIHDIGESPFNGSQHGVGIFFTAGATGSLTGSAVADYQKGGVVVSGDGTTATIADNTVTGFGPVPFIAQNGIQISSGATALVRGNTISGNWYSGDYWTACGLLFYDAGGVRQQANTLYGNQTDLCNAGRGGGNTNH